MSGQQTGNYDWNQVPEPPAFAKWVADHRLLARLILFGLDAAVVALIVTGFFSGGNRWSAYLQLPVYGWLTWNVGWLTPKSVKDWRTARRLVAAAGPGERPGDRQPPGRGRSRGRDGRDEGRAGAR